MNGRRLIFGKVLITSCFLFALPHSGSAQQPAANRNLLSTQNGGTVVLFTSRDPKSEIAQLTDGKTDTAGWRSKDGYLPQDFVFAFDKDRIAAIRSIVLNPKNPNPKSTWASNVLISISLDNPLNGFQEVGQFTLRPEAVDQELAVNRAARFLRIRIVSNGGGGFTSLGEIKAFEGDKNLLALVPAEKESAKSETSPNREGGAAIAETEPNNTSSEATVLASSQLIRGIIDPPGEEDRYKIQIPGPGSTILNIELSGEPNIRTSLDLLDSTDQVVRHFDPSKAVASNVAFSWLVEPGDYQIRMSEPSISMVLIWDTSESMRQAIGALQKGVEAYLDQVRPGERLKLIRFSRDVEVITPNFLSEPAKLREASKTKFATKQGTSLYDAITTGIKLLDGIAGNRAIVLFTDGSDSSSQLDHPGLWRTLGQSRVRLYNIGLGAGMKRYSTATGTFAERVLTHAALASNGRYFSTEKPEELKAFYQQIADELRTKSTYYLRATTAGGKGSIGVITTGEPFAAVSAAPEVEIILDCSGSMKEKINGRRKMDIARDALSRVIRDLPNDIRLALRLYGHRLQAGDKGDCQDTELVFPFGKVDKKKILETIQNSRALGNTPIAFSLQQVAADFRGKPGEKVIILATDGKEDCSGNPTAVVDDLIRQGLKFRLDIIGLGLDDKKATQEMQALAAKGSGRFYEAKDATTLAQAFQSSLAVQFEVLDAAGAKVATGVTGPGQTPVPEGVFSVVLHGDQPVIVPNVRVTRNRLTRVGLRKEGQQVGIQVTAGP